MIPRDDATAALLSFLGLAIALVVLQNVGLGPFARYTLYAVILYALLTNVPKLETLFDTFNRGLRAGVAPRNPNEV